LLVQTIIFGLLNISFETNLFVYNWFLVIDFVQKICQCLPIFWLYLITWIFLLYQKKIVWSLKLWNIVLKLIWRYYYQIVILIGFRHTNYPHCHLNFQLQLTTSNCFMYVELLWFACISGRPLLNIANITIPNENISLWELQYEDNWTSGAERVHFKISVKEKLVLWI